MRQFSIKNFKRKIALIVVLFLLSFGKSYGWSLRTHIWIGQQVLNDVMDDGLIHIGPRQYPLPAYIVDALRRYPEYFRCGNLGPDIYPDPIIGQITTHPGIEGGWKTDQWLAHLLRSSKRPQDVALAFGFMCHAAGDMFAHTYVNNYAGDVFVLTDAERDVELRHFTLEKYIERVTPLPRNSSGIVIDWKNDIKVSETYLAERLILNKDVFKQYTSSKTGLHLAAMYGVNEAVSVLRTETGNLMDMLTDWGAKYYKAQAKLVIDMTTGKQLILVAEADLEKQKLTLQLEEEVYNQALKVLSEAKRIVQKNPELITLNEQLLATQTQLAAAALAESVRIASDVNTIVNDLQNQINNMEGQISGFICKVVRWIPLVGKEMSSGCNEIDKLRGKIRGIQNDISGHKQRAAFVAASAKEAMLLRDQTKNLIEKLKDMYEEAVKGIAEGTYQSTVTIAQTKIKAQKFLITEQEKIITDLKKEQEKLQKEFNIVESIIDKVAELTKKYNVIKLLVKNWSDGISKASEEFILAGQTAGYKLLVGDGNPLDDYTRWYACYGSVFTGVPSQVGDAICFTTDQLANIRDKYNELMTGLPVILQWILNPTKKATDFAYKKMEPAFKTASFELTKFLTDQKSAEFLTMLIGWESATKEKLNQVYREDKSGKGLLKFDEVNQLIDKDLDLKGELLNVSSFFPLTNSVTMAKLALLEPQVLNQVIKDYAGEYTSPYFGTPIYNSQDERFSILIGVLGSIDGNHQWQAYALPYPRRSQNAITPLYGYDYYKDKTKGLKIWVDPYLREKVFKAIFPGSVLGSLAQRTELQWPHYKFLECASYLYPTTQDDEGRIKTFDAICRNLWQPNNVPSWELSNPLEYKKRYHQCDTIIWGDKHWTIVGSYYEKDDAELYRNLIEKKYPDLFANIAEQQSGRRFWTVMLASCTDSVRANEAKNIAIRRRIASDAYVWKHSEVFRTEPRPSTKRRRVSKQLN